MLKRGFSMFLALAAATLSLGQQKGRIAPDVAQPSAERLVAEIKWHDSLETVLAEAKRENKLGFYMHMLGKIDGDT